jgi:hypothetical protein
MNTAAVWAAKTEIVKGQIAEQKYIQATRQLAREKRRIVLEDIADKSLEVDIQRAEVGLEDKRLGLQADKLKLQGSRDNLRYLAAKNTLSQRLMAVELMSMEVNLSQSEAKLSELKTVAQTLNQKLNSYIPRNIFEGSDK